jgi:hypothetical protein
LEEIAACIFRVALIHEALAVLEKWVYYVRMIGIVSQQEWCCAMGRAVGEHTGK